MHFLAVQPFFAAAPAVGISSVATILFLLGLDHTKLTFKLRGRGDEGSFGVAASFAKRRMDRQECLSYLPILL
jgi:hypothetical protein